jgi:hypothetical protein
MIDGVPILLVLAWLVIGALVTLIVAVAVVVWVTAAALDVLVNCRPWRRRRLRLRQDEIAALRASDVRTTVEDASPYLGRTGDGVCSDPHCEICWPRHAEHEAK